jgi:hypothetical protein
MNRCSQFIPKLANAFFQSHISLHYMQPSIHGPVQPGERISPAATNQGYCMHPFDPFYFPPLHGLSIVFDRLIVDKRYSIPAAFEPIEERIPVNPRRLHGNQRSFTPVSEDIFSKGIFKVLEAITGIRELELPTDNSILSPDTGIMPGLADIHSNHQKTTLLNIFFTFLGTSGIIF